MVGSAGGRHNGSGGGNDSCGGGEGDGCEMNARRYIIIYDYK